MNEKRPNMNPEIAIRAEHVSKVYKIPHERRVTLFETLAGYVMRKVSYETFFALEDVSFSIAKGEAIGLIGKNGSGKTTLLKILSGMIPPTSGSFAMRGKVAPFLSLGVGFHHELTAEENLYLYGAILGIPRRDITRRMSDILRFADVERFRNMKLKNFSSGMVSRLAFALMIETDSDILLLDEIFAVGDKDFIPQSFAVLEAYKKAGKTIVLASHNLALIESYCHKTMLLSEGKLEAFGNTKDVIARYVAH